MPVSTTTATTCVTTKIDSAYTGARLYTSGLASRIVYRDAAQNVEIKIVTSIISCIISVDLIGK